MGAKPTGRANERPMESSACPRLKTAVLLDGGGANALLPTLRSRNFSGSSNLTSTAIARTAHRGVVDALNLLPLSAAA